MTNKRPYQRTDRLNSLLKEVISTVIRKDVKNPHVNEFTTVTRVDIAKDLRNAKVYITVMAEEKIKEETLEALRSAAPFIASKASKMIRIRFFPELYFKLDKGLESQYRIQEILSSLPKPASDET